MMKLTQRNMQIMRFINEFGFCEITQIEKRVGLKKPRSYQIMQRLTKDNLVKHEQVFHGKHGIFYLTKQGANYTDLPALKNIPKDNYTHQLTVIEIHLQLMHLFPGSMWLSEWRIKRDKSIYSIGHKSDHLVDGVLILPDGDSKNRVKTHVV